MHLYWLRQNGLGPSKRNFYCRGLTIRDETIRKVIYDRNFGSVTLLNFCSRYLTVINLKYQTGLEELASVYILYDSPRSPPDE